MRRGTAPPRHGTAQRSLRAGDNTRRRNDCRLSKPSTVWGGGGGGRRRLKGSRRRLKGSRRRLQVQQLQFDGGRAVPGGGEGVLTASRGCSKRSVLHRRCEALFQQKTPPRQIIPTCWVLLRPSWVQYPRIFLNHLRAGWPQKPSTSGASSLHGATPS